jgi:hypothetical protein
MDLVESLRVLSAEATKYAGRSHSELSSLIEEPVHLQVDGPKGAKFQVEVSASWDHKPGQSLRLFFSVDDGGVRAFLPLTRDALVLPGGVFDGELH